MCAIRLFIALFYNMKNRGNNKIKKGKSMTINRVVLYIFTVQYKIEISYKYISADIKLSPTYMLKIK